MLKVPEWLEELRRQPRDAPVGAMALLRQAVQTRQPRTVSGVSVCPEAANVLLRWHDELPVDEQEAFAVLCNTDFRALAQKCLVRAAVNALAEFLARLLGGPAAAPGQADMSPNLRRGLSGKVTVVVLRPVLLRPQDREERPVQDPDEE